VKKDLEQLIANGSTGKAITRLVEATKQLADPDLRNDILMLSARYQKMANDKDMNLIEPDQLSIETNKINKAILNLAGKVDGAENGGTKGRLWKILGSVAILVGIAAGIAEFSGYSLRDLFGGTEPEVEQPAADTTSTTIKTEGDQSPAIQSDGDVNINFGDTPPKSKEQKEKPKEAAPTPKKPAGGLQIETKGQQSPAVQGGNVEINYSNTDTTKQQ
jgi:hypothetical protein